MKYFSHYVKIFFQLGALLAVIGIPAFSSINATATFTPASAVEISNLVAHYFVFEEILKMSKQK